MLTSDGAADMRSEPLLVLGNAMKMCIRDSLRGEENLDVRCHLGCTGLDADAVHARHDLHAQVVVALDGCLLYTSICGMNPRTAPTPATMPSHTREMTISDAPAAVSQPSKLSLIHI